MSDRESRDPARIRAMFGGIARSYDLLNHLLSANRDRSWRRRAARESGDAPDEPILDLCGGTGDLSIELSRARPGEAPIVCCDFSHPMLTRARAKFGRRRLPRRCVVLEADALRLPFADGTFGAVTVAFGVRNLVDMDAGFREMLRVLRPGGRLVVLEFSRPVGPVVSRLYGFYLRRVLPRVGDRIARRAGPYGYLARTIADFPEASVLAGRIRDAGFAGCGWQTLSGGIVAVHTAFRAPSASGDPQEG